MRTSFLVATLLFLGACPDPSAPADAPATDAPPGAEGPGGPGGPGGGGGPGGPGAGGGQQQPPPLGQMKFEVKAGEGVKLSGTISYAGQKTGNLHIDFLKAGENGAFPTLMHSLSLDKAGPWEVEAPKGLGKVGIVGYVDVAGDGPNDGDPAARVPDLVDVQSDALSGLDLVLSDTPDLGEFTPGKGDKGPAPGAPPADGAGAPPGGAGAGAPPGGAPPAGAPAPDAAGAAGSPPAAPPATP